MLFFWRFVTGNSDDHLYSLPRESHLTWKLPPDVIIGCGWVPVIYYHYLLSDKSIQPWVHAQALRYIAITTENAIEVDIDDFQVENNIVPLKVKVPSPAAFIFQKGLVFTRRRNRLKSEKDLYYIFEVLTRCRELRNEIVKNFVDLKNKYTWYHKFKKNIDMHFSDRV